jgi:hypothetical protein
VPFKIVDAIGRNEKRPNGSIGVVGSEVSVLHIESGNAASLPFRFQNVFPDVTVSQLLGKMEILALGDGPERASVSFEVIVEKMLIAKPRPRGERKGI